ncbi:hypothetical protein [Lysinibacillus sp. 54212]|uniref:hypothetical protein n=1 Tax=Lysinibacillus sp. 54212 TaxID=3119829 RepID=UPI002FCA2FF2
MGKGRMMMISLILSVCFATLAVLAIVFTSEDSPLKKAKEDTVSTANASDNEETTESIEDNYIGKGIELKKDDAGIHDIFFKNEKGLEAVSDGPMYIKVNKVQLERFLPKSSKMKTLVDNREEVTMITLDLTVVNESENSTHFNLTQAKVNTDSKEQTKVDQLLSDDIGGKFTSGEKKEGKLVILLDSNPRDIASLEVNINPVMDTNYEPIGEGASIKVNLF